jgi:spore coat protein U-like protein
MKRQTLGLVLALAVLSLADASAQQQNTVSTTFKVSARVQGNCEVTASDLNFGAYSSQSQNSLKGTTVIQATCTPGTSYQIGLNAGTSPGASVNNRRMVSGTNTLEYQLYSDDNRHKVWGNTPGDNTEGGTGTGLAKDHTVFGSVPASQKVPTGDYGDTITVQVYF